MFLTKTRVLIVDDSSMAREAIAKTLRSRTGIEVVGDASSAYEAKELIMRLKPDVLLLDTDMPRMDGLTFLKLLMKHRPMPVVMLSYQSRLSSTTSIDCLNAGAVDFVLKPSNDSELFGIGEELASKLKGASSALLARHGKRGSSSVVKRYSGGHKPQTFKAVQTILMGASTGGTEALREILESLPADLPPILIVQHIPPGFSKAFADRANRNAAMTIKEATHGEIARAGVAYIAPGDFHMVTDWNGREHKIILNQSEPVWHQRPAVDTLFNAISPKVANKAVSVILTGMGRDGANGLLRLRKEGSLTIGQDAKTCAVYGMPKAAFEIGAVQVQLPLDKIPGAIVQGVRKQYAAL